MRGRTAFLSTGSLALGLLVAAIYVDTPTGRRRTFRATGFSVASPQPSGRSVVDVPIAEAQQHEAREVPVEFRIDLLPVMFFLVAEVALSGPGHGERSESCLEEVVNHLPSDWCGSRSHGIWWSIADDVCRAGLVRRLYHGIGGLPLFLSSGDRSVIELQEGARRLAGSLQRVEPTFRVLEYPAHEAELTRIRDRLSKELAEKPYFEVLSEDLGIDMYAVEARVHLVPAVDDLRGMAYRGSDGRFECFVGVEAENPTANLLVLLHEMIHVVDHSTDAPGTVFNRVRRVPCTDSNPWLEHAEESVIHGIMYAEVDHVLARVGRVRGEDLAGIVDFEMPYEMEMARRGWASHLEGAVAREAAIEQMTSLAARSGVAVAWFDLLPGVLRRVLGG